MNKDVVHLTKQGGGQRGERDQKSCTSVIYELKEAHYLQEEAQTKTQTE